MSSTSQIGSNTSSTFLLEKENAANVEWANDSIGNSHHQLELNQIIEDVWKCFALPSSHRWPVGCELSRWLSGVPHQSATSEFPYFREHIHVPKAYNCPQPGLVVWYYRRMSLIATGDGSVSCSEHLPPHSSGRFLVDLDIGQKLRWVNCEIDRAHGCVNVWQSHTNLNEYWALVGLFWEVQTVIS